MQHARKACHICVINNITSSDLQRDKVLSEFPLHHPKSHAYVYIYIYICLYARIWQIFSDIPFWHFLLAFYLASFLKIHLASILLRLDLTFYLAFFSGTLSSIYFDNPVCRLSSNQSGKHSGILSGIYSFLRPGNAPP